MQNSLRRETGPKNFSLTRELKLHRASRPAYAIGSCPKDFPPTRGIETRFARPLRGFGRSIWTTVHDHHQPTVARWHRLDDPRWLTQIRIVSFTTRTRSPPNDHPGEREGQEAVTHPERRFAPDTMRRLRGPQSAKYTTKCASGNSNPEGSHKIIVRLPPQNRCKNRPNDARRSPGASRCGPTAPPIRAFGIHPRPDFR